MHVVAYSLLSASHSQTDKSLAVPDFEVAQEIARAITFEKYGSDAVVKQFPFVGKKSGSKWLLRGDSPITEFYAVMSQEIAIEIDAKSGRIQSLQFSTLYEGDIIAKAETAEAIAHAIGSRKFGKSAMRRSFPASVVLRDGIWEFRQLRDVPDRLNPTDGAVRIQLRASDGSLVLAERKKA